MCIIESSLVAFKEGKLHVWFCVVSWHFVWTMRWSHPTHLPTTRPQPTAPAHHRSTRPQGSGSPPTRFPPRDFHRQNPSQDRPGRNPYRRQKHPHGFPTRQTTHHADGTWCCCRFTISQTIKSMEIDSWQFDHKPWVQFPTWSSNVWYDGNDRNASKHHQNSIKPQKLPAQQTSVLICTVNMYL